MKVKIVKLIASNQYIFENKPYGLVDLRNSDSETKEEKDAAIKSLKSFNYLSDEKNISRLVIILTEKESKRPFLDAELIFEETIELLKQLPVAKINNCDGAGYWVDMETGKTVPILKTTIDDSAFPSMQVFQVSFGPYSPMLAEQMIASLRGIEAIEAYVRSLHWYNNSKQSIRLYLQFLYKWIAIETITKTVNDEDIVPKLCLVLGFPTKKNAIHVPCQIRSMDKHKYKHYKKIIVNEFNKCKSIRNSIVHSGFKEANILDENMDLKLYLVDVAYNCIIDKIEKIVLSGRNTLKEVWERMFEYIDKDGNYINWIITTFLKQVDDLILGKTVF